MAVRLPDIVSRVRVDTSGLDQAKQDAGRFGDQAQGRFAGVKKAAIAAGAAIAAIKVKQFLSGAVENARESRKIMAQTAQVIETTGGAANVTADEVAGLAGEISKLTGVHDEEIQSGQNMLLTFKNIRNEVGEGNDVFNRATAIATDMSVALGQDMKSSAIQLGKALDNPIKGVTALQRVGVSFTDQQKEQIATLVESGDILGAQTLILDELATQYGGTAEAVADPSAKLAVTMDNLQQTIGDALVPVLDVLNKFLTFVLEGFNALPGPVQAIIGIGGTLATVIGLGAIAMEALHLKTALATASMAIQKGVQYAVIGATKAWTAAQWLLNAALTANPIGLVIAGIALLVAAIVFLWKKSETFREAWRKIWDGIEKIFYGVVNGVMAGIETLVNWVIGQLNQLIRAYNKIPFVSDIGELGTVEMRRFGEQGGGDTVVNNNITVNNPPDTPSTDTIQRELRKQAILGTA